MTTFLITEVRGAHAHVGESHADGVGTNLPAPHPLRLAPGQMASLLLLEWCAADNGMPFAVVPHRRISDTPLEWIRRPDFKPRGFDDSRVWDKWDIWSTGGRVAVMLVNNSDEPYTIKAGCALFRLVARDLRHMRVVAATPTHGDTLYVRTERADRAVMFDDYPRPYTSVVITAPAAIELGAGERRRVELGIALVWASAGVAQAYMMELLPGGLTLATTVDVVEAAWRAPLVITVDNRAGAPQRVEAGAPLVRVVRPCVGAPRAIERAAAGDPRFA